MTIEKRARKTAAHYGRTLPTVCTLLAAGLVVSATAVGAQDGGGQAPATGRDPVATQKAAPTAKDARTRAAQTKTGQKSAAQSKGANPSGAATRAATAPSGAPGGPGMPQAPGGAPPGAFPPGAPTGPGGPPITIFPGGAGRGAGRGGQGGFGGFGGGTGGGTRFSFDFHGADINNVLKFYSQMANETIINDSTLSGQVSITNPKQVTLDEAFTILQSVLAVRGFTAIQQKDAIVIQPFANAVKNTYLLNPGLADNGPTKVDPRNQVMTQVIPLENTDAGALAKELQPLINTGASLIASTGTNVLILTDTASNVQRFIDLTASLDKTSNQSVLKTYPLRNAEAGAVADIINNLYKQSSARGQGTGAAPQPGQPGFNPGAPPGAGAAAAGPAAVVAVGDARTNSVLVVASPGTQERIAADIISRLDDDQSNNIDVSMRKIKFADATQVANTVNTVLSNLHGNSGSIGGGNANFQQRAFGGFGGFFGGNNNNGQQQSVTSTDPLAKVVADTRTNSLIITAAPDRAKKINDLIDQLDANVPVEPTTFVFNLKNANADDVAYALSQSFGTSNNNNNPFGFFGGGGGGGGGSNGLNGNQHTPIQRRLTSTQGQAGRAIGPNRPYSTPGNTRGVPPVPPNAPEDPQTNASGADVNGGSAVPQGVPGVMTANGFVPTDTGNGADANGDLPTRQFFFGGRGFGQQQNNAPTTGRGQNGNFTNLLQLRDNVYVTSAPGGDAVIVTTTPDNYEAVRQIITALDTVPRQVMIEAIVAEVTFTKDSELGFTSSGLFKTLFGKSNTATEQLNLPAPGFLGGTATTTFSSTATGEQFTITGANYSGLLQALENNTKVKVLATPRVFTSNAQQAEVDITTKIPYIQGTTTATTGASTSQITTADIGYILNVTPRITRQGQVTLDVRSQADNLQSYTTLGSGANASTYPVVNDRYVDTEVTAQDGQTIVLGGLINTTDTLNVTKIPLLSDIPLLGQFFRGRQKSTTKTELVIFLTPHVINSVQEANDMALKAGRPVIRDIPDLPREQPNLRLPVAPPAGKTPTPQNGRATQKPQPANPGNDTTPGTNPTNPGINPNVNGGNGTP